MKNCLLFLLVILFTLTSSLLTAQDISQLKNIDVNSMSDNQIESYWTGIQEKGYTMGQVEVLGKAQGIPLNKIADFKRRVNSLNQIKAVESKAIEADSKLSTSSEAFGLKDGQVVKKKSSTTSPFGYDFFNNSKISFTPSVNIAVPENYQIGPGDEIMIDLWGASEITYKSVVNNRGSIKINGIGFIYVNGFSLGDASKKIISKLKNKHSGISAPVNSYNKINTNVTVSKIRTVQVNIIGEIKVPGTYALNSLSTVLNALYVAGGPTKMGTFREIKLIRSNKIVATLDIYSYLLFGTQKGNLKLQDQDVLLIGPYKNLISVEGAVKRTGVYELKEGQTLSELVSYFGGFTPKAYTKLLILERLNGIQKEVKEIALTESDNFIMRAGDKLVVQEILNTFENKVSIQGEVFRPGDFELLDKMNLKDLLLKAEGVTSEAFLSRGLLVRTQADASKENIAFSVADVLSGKTSIFLQSKDEVRIFNEKELRKTRTISISGAINTPKTIEFIDKLQIEDIIALSGGLQEGANPDVISVSRRLKDGSFTTLSKVFSISSKKNLSINNGVPFYLEPFDIINVRYLKGYAEQKSVAISGEVNYSGSYVLTTKNERISDLIERAGGFTEFAYVKGAALVRKTKNKYALDLLQNMENNEGKEVDLEALTEMEANSKKFTVGIDLEKILKNKGSDIDMFMEVGDLLIIPSKKQTVKVSGMVLKPSLIQFKKGESLKSYINKSGGFAETAKKSKIYVSYQNGDVKTVRKFLFFKSYPRLAPGATIFVPAKPINKNKLSTTEIVGITTSIATLGILIQSLLK